VGTLPALGSALYQKLANDATVASQIGGTAAPRLYWQLAPPDTEYPLVIFSLGAGNIPNMTPHDAVNWVYRITAIAQTRAAAEDVHNAVYTALHEQTLSVDGWDVYWMACERVAVPPVEVVDGHYYWRFAADYRIRACSN